MVDRFISEKNGISFDVLDHVSNTLLCHGVSSNLMPSRSSNRDIAGFGSFFAQAISKEKAERVTVKEAGQREWDEPWHWAMAFPWPI